LGGKPLNVVYDSANKQVLLVAGTISATLDASGNLTVADADGTKNNNLTISTSSENLVISDANEAFIAAPAGGSLSPDNKTLTIPLNLVSNSLTINAAGGNDTITVSEATALTSALTINGGTGNDTINLN